MTELKYLEDVLPTYRAGKAIVFCDLYYNFEQTPLHMNNKTEERLEGFLMMNPGLLLDKKWKIKKELVSWPVAWEALKAGKRVKLLGRMWTCARMCGEHVIFTGDPMDVNYDKDRKIPISWLDRDDFEVCDDNNNG